MALGIFARAFVRDYARAIGLDADAVVDEFCRQYPQGDRRTSRIVKAQGELIGHKVDGGSEPLPAGRERRRRAADPPPPPMSPIYTARVVAAAFDAICVCLFGVMGVTVLGQFPWRPSGCLRRSTSRLRRSWAAGHSARAWSPRSASERLRSSPAAAPSTRNKRDICGS